MRRSMICAGVLLLCGCERRPQAPALEVFAAASTTEAMEAVARRFERETGVVVRLNCAASSTLARQIEAGADAALFLSANEEWADYLDARGLVRLRRDLFGNRLVAATAKGGSVTLREPEDLASESVERIAVAEPESVPAGRYAKRALTALGLWDRVERKLVPTQDVRQALLLVERGEVEASIVYATDAAASTKAETAFAFDPALTGDIRYPLLLLPASDQHPEAKRLYDYLASPNAAAVFRSFGFEVIGTP